MPSNCLWLAPRVKFNFNYLFCGGGFWIQLSIDLIQNHPQGEEFKTSTRITLVDLMKIFILYYFLFLFCFSQSMMANNKIAMVNQRLLQDLSKDEISRVVYITRQLISIGDKRRLLKFLQHLQGIVYKRRLAKCIKIFSSQNICQNNANFYIWAQNLAKDIMDGASVWWFSTIETQSVIGVYVVL